MGGAGHEAPWVAPPGISWRATGSRSVPLIAVESWPDHSIAGGEVAAPVPFGGAGPPNFGVGFSIAPLAEYGGLSGAAAIQPGLAGRLVGFELVQAPAAVGDALRRTARRSRAGTPSCACRAPGLPCCSSSSSLSSVAGRPWMSVMVSSSTGRACAVRAGSARRCRGTPDAVVDPGALYIVVHRSGPGRHAEGHVARRDLQVFGHERTGRRRPSPCARPRG